MTGAISKLPLATICVAFETAGGAVTSIAPFHVSGSGGLNARVVTPRHHAIPRFGWVSSGRRVSQALREHALAPQLVTWMRRFTCTTYDGALLLRALAQARPDLECSVSAVTSTLANYETNLRSFASPPSLARTATRSTSIKPYAKVRVRRHLADC